VWDAKQLSARKEQKMHLLWAGSHVSGQARETDHKITWMSGTQEAEANQQAGPMGYFSPVLQKGAVNWEGLISGPQCSKGSGCRIKAPPA